MPAHAETSCSICFTISITGTDGGGDDGGGGFEIRDPDDACQIAAEGRYDGDAGAQAAISLECCSANLTLGPTSTDTIFRDLVVGGDSSPCAIEDNIVRPT